MYTLTANNWRAPFIDAPIIGGKGVHGAPVRKRVMLVGNMPYRHVIESLLYTPSRRCEGAVTLLYEHYVLLKKRRSVMLSFDESTRVLEEEEHHPSYYLHRRRRCRRQR